MSINSTKPTIAFWVISVLALLWNLIGVMAYLTRAFITDEMIATLPEPQQAEFAVVYPAWVTAAFALAVFCGALGTIALLIRKKWATNLFLISAIAAFVQHVYIFLNVEVNSFIMPVLVLLICVFLFWYTKKCADDGILN
ncbi:hypothetical protein [uncultured Polaribacter sp.]|uniref:hypothetical protein n=1 Tax=uncultured Polaribacter sp. TaxID=174711 RepID=UPI0030D856B1|tara:strand:+ start:1272 stop:1691 length:420 start_codon:yes stop_codon:yes gene_type:complete